MMSLQTEETPMSIEMVSQADATAFAAVLVSRSIPFLFRQEYGLEKFLIPHEWGEIAETLKEFCCSNS